MHLKSICAVAAFVLVTPDFPPANAGLIPIESEIQRLAKSWRVENRIIDLHQHIDYTPEHLARAVRIMDRAGIGIEVNLSGGTTTHEEGKPSEFERNKELADKLFPGRFMHYMNLDYTGWDQADFIQRGGSATRTNIRHTKNCWPRSTG